MLDRLGVAGSLVLQHVLDQVDAAARAVELVAEQHVGRAGRGAEAAMHAGAQNLFRIRRCRDRRAASGVKSVCMTSDARVHAAGIEDAARVEAFLHARRSARRAGGLRLEDRRRRRAAPSGARTSVAWPLPCATIADAQHGSGAPIGRAGTDRDPDRPPPQSKKYRHRAGARCRVGDAVALRWARPRRARRRSIAAPRASSTSRISRQKPANPRPRSDASGRGRAAWSISLLAR